MDILLWILFGALAGWVAWALSEGAQQNSTLDISIGILGAVLTGFSMNFTGGDPVTGFNLYSFVVAFIGASLLIAIVKASRYIEI